MSGIVTGLMVFLSVEAAWKPGKLEVPFLRHHQEKNSWPGGQRNVGE